jgi:hypothetical protein
MTTALRVQIELFSNTDIDEQDLEDVIGALTEYINEQESGLCQRTFTSKAS